MQNGQENGYARTHTDDLRVIRKGMQGDYGVATQKTNQSQRGGYEYNVIF
jgi:hypothetical protein